MNARRSTRVVDNAKLNSVDVYGKKLFFYKNKAKGQGYNNAKMTEELSVSKRLCCTHPRSHAKKCCLEREEINNNG